MHHRYAKTASGTSSVTKTSIMEARLTEIESRLAFQEATIEELNQALMQQTLEINKQRQQLRLLAEKLQHAQSPLASATEEAPPPHY